jgi:hypothetical protein
LPALDLRGSRDPPYDPPAVQRVRFFPDFGGADPLWDANGVGISLETLPLSTETKAALRAWCARWEPLARRQIEFEDFDAGMTDRPVEPIPAQEWQAVEDEGRQLCDHVRQELGDEWQVLYEGPG